MVFAVKEGEPLSNMHGAVRYARTSGATISSGSPLADASPSLAEVLVFAERTDRVRRLPGLRTPILCMSQAR